MLRAQWDDLPGEAKAEVERRFGDVLTATSADAQLTVGVAARLHTTTGDVFLKGAPEGSPSIGHYEREQHVGSLLPASVPAPRMLWGGHAAGWLLLAFEAVDGRHADLSPGSRDVPGALDAVALLGDTLTPCPWPDAPPVTDKLNGMTAVARKSGADLDDWDGDDAAGDTLLHADLHAENLLVTGGRVHVIDWSLACRGAAWVDVALLVGRLIAAGHTPGQAEQMAGKVPAWHQAPGHLLDRLAMMRAAFAGWMAVNGPPHRRARAARTAAACRAWAQHRCSATP